jgi:hypothetical protein
MKLKKKFQLKKRHKKQPKSTRVNPLSIILGSWGWNNIIESKQKKSWSLIFNQLNIKWWNWKKKQKKTELIGLTQQTYDSWYENVITQ